MLILGLDSSHSEGSLCLQKDSQILESLEWKQEKSHAELIATFLDKALKNHNLKTEDIDVYSVNVGPGSFTGIRISINTIKTLSFVHKKPIYAFNSLETIAQSCSLDQKNLVVAINAHSDLCYVGKLVNAVDFWKLTSDISVLPSQKLNELLKEPNTCFVGDAFSTYKDKITTSILYPKSYRDIPQATSLISLANSYKNDSQKIKTWETLEPFYVRLSSPEEKQANALKS